MKNPIQTPTTFSLIRSAALIALTGIWVVSLSAPSKVLAQTNKAKPATQVKMAPAPAAEDLILETKDKVQLKCTYFSAQLPESEAAAKTKGKTVVPILILHDWGESRKGLAPVATFLQSQGNAVMTVDLRGHGESVTVTGNPKKIDHKKIRGPQIETAMLDIERCKKYLVQRHNEGKLNIDLLTVVAVGKTCSLAAKWTIADWFQFPAINSEGIKQGQDVKSLVFIAPRKKLQSISLVDQLKHSLFTGSDMSPMPLVMVWCRGDKQTEKDASYLFEKLEKARPDLDEFKTKAEREENRTLFRATLPQAFTGTQLMEKPVVKGLWPFMQRFVQTKISDNASKLPWKSREKKKDDE
jgi:hypothetical protein